jgi:hypothetical protein
MLTLWVQSKQKPRAANKLDKNPCLEKQQACGTQAVSLFANLLKKKLDWSPP